MNACRALPALLAIFVSTCACAKSAYDRTVARDSEVVRAIHAQPLKAEVYDLLLAHETLRLAQDEPTATALGAYLSRLAIARLSGSQSAPPVATIGELPRAGLPTAADKSALAAVMASSLRATLVRAGQRDLIARLENTSPHTIRQYDLMLNLPIPGGDVYVFSCDRMGYIRPPLAPGEALEAECGVELNSLGIEAFLATLAAHPGATLPVVARGIEFLEPKVTVGKDAAWWKASVDAQERAVLRMRELPCRMRGACGDDFGEWLSGRPQYVVIPAAALAGLLAGALIGRFTRRRSRNALVASSVFAAITVVAWFATGASNTGLAAILLLFLAVGMVATFVIAVWIGAALFARDRGQL